MSYSRARAPVTAYVAIGANLGNAQGTVTQAMLDLEALPGTQVMARSSLYRTAPIGAGGPDYINAVAAIATALTAPELLRLLQHLEQVAGRERPYRNAPRTLDLDILLYGSACIDSPSLTVPHPRMAERAFVLMPLAEIGPDLVTPRASSMVAEQRIERIC
ncbi:2-amino-4-hydroxy-6-hydroxymethyldihydropteridine diphosphokinase [Ottowia caeni]|uniref:2-amino-4-hydroxy-6- hydroxymethyldihydropteridine diphosphokinase n=1 Tax=Ottowia caeni TaxID=2870339 RepID=UPI001E2BB4CA|nr:2-amino-4-hydroxy-6-hydroxymethyldihydropteridine diphosphokinase [Ottowia caeni]